MPAPHETTFRVFYSWQSDLPDAVNLRLIRNALTNAAGVINSDPDANLHVVIDEATREVPGSPNIEDSIFAKIKEADVFVCDLTKTAEVQNADGQTRKYCNPNAAIELGYAIRVLGWNRIILVCNDAYMAVPDDLPFDARGHRASIYHCEAQLDEKGKPTAACQAQISNATGALRTTLLQALQLIARANPKRPHELEVISPEAIRHERDVVQLTNLFYWINLAVMNDFIERLGYGSLTIIGSDFFDRVDSVINGAAFHINDVELRTRIECFYRAWQECFRYSHSMDLRPGGGEAYFGPASHSSGYAERMAQYKHTASQTAPLRAALDSLLDYVREKYLEVDPSTCGREAAREYRETQERIRRGSGDD